MTRAAQGGRLVILDRDGVINQDSAAFIKSPAEWVPIEGSVEAIALLSRAGFTVAVASNQSGIGRNLLHPHTLYAIHRKMRRAVGAAGGALGRIVYCPHVPDDVCECRKPGPGLLLRLASYYRVPLNGLPVIGDSLRDIFAAEAAGARPVLVLTGNGHEALRELRKRRATVECFEDLLHAAEALVSETGRGGTQSCC